MFNLWLIMTKGTRHLVIVVVVVVVVVNYDEMYSSCAGKASNDDEMYSS